MDKKLKERMDAFIEERLPRGGFFDGGNEALRKLVTDAFKVCENFFLYDGMDFKEQRLFDEEYSFSRIWDMYQKKKGDKKKAKEKWDGLKAADKKAVFGIVPAYVTMTEITYRKDFITFLNQRAWEDEGVFTNGIMVPYGTFNPKLVGRELFKDFIEHFNNKIRGTQIPQVVELTEHRRVLFNIAYCLHFYKIKTVVEKAMTSSRLNGTGNVNWKADFDWIFEPVNFMRIFEGVYDDVKTY